MVRRFARITIQNDAGKCHMKFSGHLWEAKVVNRGVKMHIHWIKYSKPLRILDIFVEYWMEIWQKWVKIRADPHGI